MTEDGACETALAETQLAETQLAEGTLPRTTAGSGDWPTSERRVIARGVCWVWGRWGWVMSDPPGRIAQIKQTHPAINWLSQSRIAE